MQVKIRGGEVENVELQIYEPPRFFEAFLRGRSFAEAPDITARICGICPVAYMTSAFNAMEDALGAEVDERIRVLRRIMYCGEWIESHALHVFLLHAPDFFGFDSAWQMAREHRDVVEGALRVKAMGNDLLRTIGGRAIHPINVRVGGFYKAPAQGAPRRARSGARGVEGVHARARRLSSPGSTSPTSSRTTSSSPCATRTATRSRTGDWSRAPASTSGPASTRSTSPSSTSRTRPRSSRGCPTAAPTSSGRWRATRSTSSSSPTARSRRPRDAGLGESCRNPFKSILVRSVEILYALEEALALIAAYEPPDPPAVVPEPRASTGTRWSEAPRGMLWHRYRLEEDGSIAEARIVPPTSQNQARIEQDLLEFVRAAGSISRMTGCSGSASRRSATTTPASAARPTS